MENIEVLYERATDFVAKNSKDIEKAGKALAIGTAVYYTASKLYDAYFGPLSHLPGPFLGRFTKYSKASFEKPVGTGYVKLLELHEKYGPVVRLGPKYISVSDKDMVKQILVKDDLMKGPNYGFLDKQSMFSTRDKVFHKLRRRVVSPAFSIKYLNSLEPFMGCTLKSFTRKIDSDIQATRNADGYGSVDLWILFQCLALDIIGETAFGQTFHMIEHNNHPVPTSIGKGLMVAHYFMTRIVRERMEGGEAVRRNDILQILIDTQKAQKPEERLSVEAIITETVLFLIAGSETTSNTTGFAVIELLKRPEALAKLRQEIDAIALENGELFKHDQLKHLPYLNAVINETLRLDWIGALGLDRVTTQDMILGKDLFVPNGTIINASIYHLHMNPKYWKNPKEFRPERWLEGADPAPDMDAFYPFSAGSRNCIGKNFALQEMRLALATLFKLYDLQPIPEEMKDAEQVRQYFTLQVKKNSFKCLIKRRSA